MGTLLLFTDDEPPEFQEFSDIADIKLTDNPLASLLV